MPINGIAHKNLTDPQLHEPKGASTASANQVPFADGEGGTSWQDITPDKLVITPETIEGASESGGTVITKLNTSGLPGTASDSMSTAVNFTGVNQNVLNDSSKINELIDEIASLNSRYAALATSYNSLLEALKNLGLISVIYPR